MKNKIDTKGLREQSQNAVKEGITSLDKLKAGLIILKQLVENLSHMRKVVREAAADVEALSKACAVYATKHPKGCFGDTAIYDDNGKLKSGDIRLVDCNCDAHYLLSLEDFKRVDGGQLTQEFLEGLPKGWVKKSVKISTADINKLVEKGKVTEAEIAEAKLERKPKHEWSWQLIADATAGEVEVNLRDCLERKSLPRPQ